MTSIIVPANGYLNFTWFEETNDLEVYDYKPFPFDRVIRYIDMSPNYPSREIVGYYVDGAIYSCNLGIAAFTLTLYIDIPKNCSLTITIDEQPPIEFQETTFRNHTLTFNATQVATMFNGRTCANSTYTGFLIQIEAHYITPVKNENKNENGLIIGTSSGGFVVICIIVIATSAYFIRKRRNRYDKIYKILKEMNMTPEEITEKKASSDRFLVQPGKIHINFDSTLGKGVSSTVYKGRLIGMAPLHELQNTEQTQKFVDCDVAVKIVNHFGQSEVEQLFKEIEAMKTVGYHENVLCMLGWAMAKETPCLIFEIAEKNLLQYVSEFRDTLDVPYKKFLSVLWQITNGMQYIASKGLIHRDLAARNILLFEDYPFAKISDFGLCCSIDDLFSSLSSLKLPIKWLALESLTDHVFSEKSDVWSFGVLMYEVFTFGKIPYATMSYDEQLVFLQARERLERPENMDDVVYEIMVSCMLKDVEKRPTFEELEERFHDVVEENFL